MPRSERPRVVILVDSRSRDLAVSALIAHHLERRGVECLLEPLEAYRAVLAAYRPHMIVFNHLTASHLVSYSKRLAQMGVLTAVLPNEGINYDEDDLKFNSGKHHSGAHIDYFFCWNGEHRRALEEAGFGSRTRIEVVGVPRFDFYFEPWSRVFYSPDRRPRARPQVLLCTNFQIARFRNLPRAQADKFFEGWKNRIPTYTDYWTAIEQSYEASRRVFDFADALVDADRFELIVRPHPREEVAAYANWLERLPPDKRKWTRVDSSSNIAPLILGCDLEISCETCTTAMESWIAGKPTIELLFYKNPMFFHEEHGASNTACADPGALPRLVDRVLQSGEAPAVLAARRRHLEKWCNTPDGNSSGRLADIVAEAVLAAPEPDWSRIEAADRRRAAKLGLLRRLGLAYHFDPFMPLKMRLNRGRYAVKSYAYDKSIKPSDVSAVQEQLKAVLGK